MACHLPARNSEASFVGLAQHLLLQTDYQLEAMEPSSAFSFSSSSSLHRRTEEEASFPVLPTTTNFGAFNHNAPINLAALYEDATPDWMDTLMINLSPHAVYFNDSSNPCESTESSDLPVAQSNCGGSGSVVYPCSPGEEFSFDFYNSNEMLSNNNNNNNNSNNNNNYYYMQEEDPLVAPLPLPLPQPHFNPARALREINTVKPNVAVNAVKSMASNEPNMWAWNSTPVLVPPPKPGVKSGMKRDAGSNDPSSSSSSHGLQLLNILCECAKTVDSQPAMTEIALSRLRSLSSPIGDPIQRLSSYFADALHKRLLDRKGLKHINSESICSIEEYTLAYKAFNDACPYFKFAHLTANEAILEAMDSADRIHIIDFGISHGVQWAALLQALATRPAGKPAPRIRLTGIASPSLRPDRERDSLIATGKRLAEFAKLLDLEFEFHPIWVAMELVETSMVQIEEGERVAVNFMLELSQLLGENSDVLKATLKTVEAMAPEVVTLAEFDVSLNNSGGFHKRFLNALQFYLAIFESLEATMARESTERIKVERWFFGEGMIQEMVSCEGAERKKRLEGREQWRNIMESAGFRASCLSNYAVSQARLLLWLYCEAFTLLQGQDQTCLSLAWHNRPILTISAWTPLTSPSS